MTRPHSWKWQMMSLNIITQWTMIYNYNPKPQYPLYSHQHVNTEWLSDPYQRVWRAMFNRHNFKQGKSLHSQKLPVILTLSSWDWVSFLGAANWCQSWGRSRHQRKQHDTDSFTLSGPYGKCYIWPIVVYWPPPLGICHLHEQNLGLGLHPFWF